MKTRPIIDMAFAEDHVMVRDGIIELLHDTNWPIGFHVSVSAENGKDLIAKLEKVKKIPDVCLLDLYMPEMDAWATLPILRNRWPSINVLILTMEKDEYKANLLMAGGAKGYLNKSGNPAVLKNAIEVVHKGGIYFDRASMQYQNLDTQVKIVNSPSNKAIVGTLTPSEIEIIQLLHKHPEMAWKEMTVPLKKTYKTLDRIKQRIYDKLNVHNRSELIKFAIEHGVV